MDRCQFPLGGGLERVLEAPCFTGTAAHRATLASFGGAITEFPPNGARIKRVFAFYSALRTNRCIFANGIALATSSRGRRLSAHVSEDVWAKKHES